MTDEGDWWPGMWPYFQKRDECPNRGRHRGPQGPNEDVGMCAACGSPAFSKRPPNETFGDHADDCSLPIDHESYCQPGGAGHPAAEIIRG